MAVWGGLTNSCEKREAKSKGEKEKYKSNTVSTSISHEVNRPKIRLIIFFAAKDGEALYSQQKQHWEVIVAQMTNSLLPNSD